MCGRRSEELGIGDAEAAALGLRLYKVAMPWPLEPEGARRFAEGLDEVLVVEEKRAVIETQLKDQLYNWPADRRPRILGKFDEAGELDIAVERRTVAGADRPRDRSAPGRAGRCAAVARANGSPASTRASARSAAQRRNVVPFARTPYFCSGCPHNTSTRVPEGSRALAGIGCHYLSQFMDRNTATFTQMGGEGAAWIGQAPFVETTHVFANIGDGTYTHSGILAIRAAVAADVTMTYKVLFNDAVAMTGGQPLDGGLTVPRVAAQLAAEGVRQVVIVTDEPHKYPPGTEFPHGATRAPPRRTRRRCSANCAKRAASPRSFTTRPAPPKNAAAASAAVFRTRRNGSSSTIWFARAAAIVRRPRTACRSCRSRPNSAASARSTSRAATRIFPASRASARAL